MQTFYQIYISKQNLNFEGSITKCRINSHGRLLRYIYKLFQKRIKIRIKQLALDFLLTHYSYIGEGKTSLEKMFIC